MFLIEAKWDVFLPKYKNSGYWTYDEAYIVITPRYNYTASQFPKC